MVHDASVGVDMAAVWQKSASIRAVVSKANEQTIARIHTIDYKSTQFAKAWYKTATVFFSLVPSTCMCERNARIGATVKPV